MRRAPTLHKYLTELLQPEQWDGTRASETRYLFGNSRGEGWNDLFQHYERPPCATCGEEKGVLNFGAGGRHSGVGWHVHGPAYSETLWGRKRWFLYPASKCLSSHGVPRVDLSIFYIYISFSSHLFFSPSPSPSLQAVLPSPFKRATHIHTRKTV